MTAPAKPFVTSLRARGTIAIAPDGAADALTIRVQIPEIWDIVAVVALPSEPVVTVKQRALATLYPQAGSHEDFVLKLRGWEILDEHVSLAEAGVVNGSTLLLTHRRRRAIK